MSTFAALFNRALSLNPEGMAVDAHDGQMTYRELDARAEALARALQKAGIGDRKSTRLNSSHLR